MRERAIFLDRDGTLVHPRHYPRRPEELQIYGGITERLHLLQQAGWLLILITNQSGVARGYFTLADLELMHAHLAAELARAGVRLDAVYYCPHHPDGVVPELAVPCGCRKPAPGMLLQAAAELNIDLQRSWFLGDILDDVEAGNRAGCRTILVDLGTEALPDSPLRTPAFVARDTRHALRLIESAVVFGMPVEQPYRPPQWQAKPIALGEVSQ